MKKITDHIYQISMGAVNAFVIEDNGLTLVDTGVKDSQDKIFAAIRKAGKRPEDIRQIILTHSHPDHSGSAAAIKRSLNIPVYAHAEDAQLVEQGIGGRLPHQPSPGFLNWILFHLFIKNSPNETEATTIDHLLADGDVLPIAGGIQVIHTPGHSKGHIALLVNRDKTLIAGDICANLLGLDFSIVYEDRALATESILKAASFGFENAVFGHGNALLGNASEKIRRKFTHLQNKKFMKFLKYSIWLFVGLIPCFTNAQQKPDFKVIAFFTGKNDQAHISFVGEAHKWFPKMAAKHHFQYDSTSNWNNLNAEYLSQYQVVLFLDTRPEGESQRQAFQKYMENGGGWIGFHFAAFALSPSAYPQNWDWYHNTFLGSGQYKSNTWRPTPAILKVEKPGHPAMKGLPNTFKSAPNEWYRWEKDLKANPDIEILLSIDPGSFPLGTGPKQHEIWHSGYYPVVWTNKKFRMLYMNMGHNDIDYENKTNKELSFTFDNQTQNQLLINTLLWLGRKEAIK